MPPMPRPSAFAVLQAAEGAHQGADNHASTSSTTTETSSSTAPLSPSSGGPSPLPSSDAAWSNDGGSWWSRGSMAVAKFIVGHTVGSGRGFRPPCPFTSARGRSRSGGRGRHDLDSWCKGPSLPTCTSSQHRHEADANAGKQQKECSSDGKQQPVDRQLTGDKDTREELMASLRACIAGPGSWEVGDDDLQVNPGQRLGYAPAGTVHRAMWRGTTPVAVKMFHAHVPRELWAFRSQVSMLTRLHHPNILQLLGILMQPPLLGTVTELMARGSIYHLLHRSPGLKMLPQQRLTAALHAARAVAYLHACKPPLMHGDIKSVNLFLDEHGVVKLGGFWLCEEVRRRRREGDDDSAYEGEISESSPEYWWPAQMRAQASAEWMSPEALRGDPCDEKSDVFSFGVILWELATGDAPWHQVPHTAVVQYTVGGKGERLPVPEDIHPQLRQVIQDCWQEDPSARPSMADVYRRLSELQEIVPSDSCQAARVSSEQAARQEDPSALLASWQNAAHPWQIHHADLTRGQRLGVGAFGEVFHGWWHQSTEVAIKVLLEQELSPDELRAFKDEVTIMSKLRHPNVVQFLGAVLEEGHLAIITEYMPAGNLFKQLHRPECAAHLTAARRLSMAKDVARGLQYLHSHRPAICHRDLKSPNLLCERNGTVKLADFGLSIAKQATFVTGKGTPAWMAPEALRDGRCDEKSDVFSYGVVLWELVTGDIPWKGLPRPDALPFLVANGERLRIPDDIHPEVQALIADCWHEAPSQRPTCGQILERLSQLSEITPSPSRAAAHRAVLSVPAAGISGRQGL